MEADCALGPDHQVALVSRVAGLAFPIRQGIPIMLIDEARQIAADDK